MAVAAEPQRLLLLDKSAYVRGAAAFDLAGELCLCAVTHARPGASGDVISFGEPRR